MGLEQIRNIKSGKDRTDREEAKKEKAKAKAREPKFSKPMPHRTEKMKGIISALRPLYDKFLKNKTECEIKSPACTGQVTEVHHTKGRGVKVILDDTYWKACCNACNLYVERKDAEAREKGFKISRHAKP